MILIIYKESDACLHWRRGTQVFNAMQLLQLLLSSTVTSGSV